jgi:two-component system phosphate regulon response regulator OmpR
MSEALARILVADDEADLRALLQRYLSDQGYSVRCVDSAPPLDKLLARERFDVLVLDVMMPGEDGLAICRRLRAQGETIPILMLTARGDPLDRIIGLEMGADDYLPKPFNPRELLARIQALVRRQRMLGVPGAAAPAAGSVSFGVHTLHLAERRLERRVAGQPQDVPLTSAEFALLQALAQHPHRPLGRERLIELARGRDHEATDRSIDVQVMRLRRLIEADPAKPRHIQTVWGVGYVFVPDGAGERS